jgi:hypothetical protein
MAMNISRYQRCGLKNYLVVVIQSPSALANVICEARAGMPGGQ